MKLAALFFILAALPMPGQSIRTNPFADDKDAIQAGRGTFRIYCSPCHGIGAKGGRGPDLTLGTFSAGDTDQALLQVISEGVPGTEMGDYGSRLGEENVWRVVSYIRSVSNRTAPKVAGDGARGEKLFWGKAACGQCHRVGTRGGRLGPDLTLVGRQRSLDYLVKSLTEPGAELTPGYNTITVVLPDGKTITGVERNYDGFSAQFMDTSENFHSCWKDEVKEMKRETRSLMPSYQNSLTSGERDDVLAYMLSLRGNR